MCIINATALDGSLFHKHSVYLDAIRMKITDTELRSLKITCEEKKIILTKNDFIYGFRHNYIW